MTGGYRPEVAAIGGVAASVGCGTSERKEKGLNMVEALIAAYLAGCLCALGIVIANPPDREGVYLATLGVLCSWLTVGLAIGVASK